MSGALHPNLTPGSASLTTGHIVDGKYSIDSILGEGGMGVVYLATDIHTNVPVVVKAIRSEYAHREEFRNRILAEGRALARIDHQNVVRLNAVVVEPDGLFLVMQYIDGESLDKTISRYVAQQTPMPVPLVLKIFHQVLDGVGAAHAEGVIHRDLKPANILIRRRDAVAKVTDFGIAKAEEDIQAGRGQTKGIIGSLLYMAPEQIKGLRDLDNRVDIYGLGILLYEMLVGRVPFDAPSEFEIMKLHLEAEIPLISRMRSDVPAYLDTAIHRACAKNREDRFTTTAEMAAALQADSTLRGPSLSHGSSRSSVRSSRSHGDRGERRVRTAQRPFASVLDRLVVEPFSARCRSGFRRCVRRPVLPQTSQTPHLPHHFRPLGSPHTERISNAFRSGHAACGSACCNACRTCRQPPRNAGGIMEKRHRTSLRRGDEWPRVGVSNP